MEISGLITMNVAMDQSTPRRIDHSILRDSSMTAATKMDMLKVVRQEDTLSQTSDPSAANTRYRNMRLVNGTSSKSPGMAPTLLKLRLLCVLSVNGSSTVRSSF